MLAAQSTWKTHDPVLTVQRSKVAPICSGHPPSCHLSCGACVPGQACPKRPPQASVLVQAEPQAGPVGPLMPSLGSVYSNS